MTNLTFPAPVIGLRAFRSIAMCALLAGFGAPAYAEQFTFQTFDYPGADFTAGFTISPSGEIGGLACAGPSCQGFLFQVGTSPVPVTPPGASSSWVTGIQKGGFLLSGQYNDATGNAHGYVWDLLHPSNFMPIDPDPNGVLFTEVADMNPAGNLAGWYRDLSGVGHGYARINDVLTSFDLPGATYTAAYGISPGGDLVGTYCDASICHAYLLRGGISGALTTIDAPGAVETDAFGINPLGQIVGDYCDATTCHGYLRNPNGDLITVEPPGSGFAIAFAINPVGQITGLSCDDSGCHGFLATPQRGQVSQTSAVPATAVRRFWPLSNSLHRLGKGGLARLLSQR
jgi:uncharacterized membrane protein